MDISRSQMMIGAAAVPVAGRAAALSTGLASPMTKVIGPGSRGNMMSPVTSSNWKNGNWGMMARPVLDRYAAAVQRVNRETSYYARRGVMSTGSRLTRAVILDQFNQFVPKDDGARRSGDILARYEAVVIRGRRATCGKRGVMAMILEAVEKISPARSPTF
nr:hypothetical protein [Sphingobium sp. Z007]